MENEKNKTNRNNIILVPTDFSEVCENATHHGADLARYLNFQLVMLHVVNKDTKEYLKKQDMTMDNLKEKLSELVNRFKAEYTIDADYLIKEGNIISLIGETADEIGANLLILGTHGKTGFQRLTGSYAVKVVTNVEIPTIIVQKRSFPNGYKNIVFPVTVSTKDRQKVNWATYMAKTFNSTIHIFPKYESDKFTKSKIMAIVKQIKAIFVQNNVGYVDRVSDDDGGNYAKQLIDYAVVNEADLIMIMNNTDSLLPLFDTWAEQIIFNSSQIPVIVINPVNVKNLSWH